MHKRTAGDVIERLEVPESNSPIRGPRGQEEFVRVELYDGNRAIVGRELPEEFSGLQVPDLLCVLCVRARVEGELVG